MEKYDGSNIEQKYNNAEYKRNTKLKKICTTIVSKNVPVIVDNNNKHVKATTRVDPTRNLTGLHPGKGTHPQTPTRMLLCFSLNAKS